MPKGIPNTITMDAPPTETVVKESEKRVFFFPPAGLNANGQEAAALLAKDKFEQENGTRLVRFRFDPLCGGVDGRGGYIGGWAAEWV